MALLLPVYLASRGQSSLEIGIVVGGVATGNLLWSLSAPRLIRAIGLRALLSTAPLTMAAGGLLLFYSSGTAEYFIAALVGSVSITQTESGIFLVLDNAILPDLTSPERRNEVFSLYNMVGYAGSGVGALLDYLFGAFVPSAFRYDVLLLLYSAAGLVLSIIYSRLEIPEQLAALNRPTRLLEVARRSPIVSKLALLFGVDAFAGGLTLQSWLSYWFFTVYHFDLSALGALFIGVNILSALSLFAAAKLANRYGLVRVMVFSHLPSNMMLLAIPFAGSAAGAAGLLLGRQLLSQMDVPTRQSLVMTIAAREDRPGAAALTTATRNISQVTGSPLTGLLLQLSFISAPFVISGSLKSAYDLAVLALMRGHLSVGKVEAAGSSK